ncbi:MAG: SAM-dependent chlorinase/fluorinase [Rhodospirillaceae bacterium]|jgi:S-adenosyl-L-methionine hydrolase (adenosine-forming)|nr:SAM-dependent chlorinase/fluorinase [Rhodospirillaceae bacterium]MBT6116818.1 SAM-dependent chlorinase/fluorinase [Rhodospirillaceae bacterium]
MIVLFTDFGVSGPYVGQMKAVLAREAPGVPVIDLFADAPVHDPRAGAYLLAAYCEAFESGDILLCVVDPGVGGPRSACIVEAGERLFVGPANGLFELVRRRAADTAIHEITWRPGTLSASFHGRDLFAPVAARLARGSTVPSAPRADDWDRRPDWPDDLAEVAYIDHFGNAISGLRAETLGPQAVLRVGGRRIPRARTFSDLPKGEVFWYENANGLAELAINRGRADRVLDLGPGTQIDIEAP